MSHSDQANIVKDKSQHAQLRARDLNGRQRTAYFEYTAVAGDSGLQDLIPIDDNCRLLEGRIYSDGLGAGATLDLGLRDFGSSGEISPGVADDPDFLESALATNAALSADINASDSGLGNGYVTQRKLWLTGTLGAAPTAGQKVWGYITFVQD